MIVEKVAGNRKRSKKIGLVKENMVSCLQDLNRAKESPEIGNDLMVHNKIIFLISV